MNTASSNLKIELIFDSDCPNVPQARGVISRALERINIICDWQEWERSDPACPAYARFCGSPTILVNEKDVSQSSQNESSCCRVYLENPEFKGCPSLDDVVAALQQACALHD